MRTQDIMFAITKGFFELVLKASDRFWVFMTAASTWMGGKTHWLIGQTAIVALKVVDKKKLDEIKAQADLSKQQAELELMSSASKLRDHAVETGEWGAEHTFAINAIGEALINACDWEEDAVHNYLRGVVEAVPGLQYDIEANEDDLLY